jgi:hypothetical protein
MSVSVALHPGRTRELILDFALEVSDTASAPPRERVLGTVESGIRAALRAGWDPESRGRAFRYEIEQNG